MSRPRLLDLFCGAGGCIVVCLAYAGRHDGRVPAPMLRRVLGVER